MNAGKELVLKAERKTIEYAIKYLKLKFKDDTLTEKQNQEYKYEKLKENGIYPKIEQDKMN